MSLRVTRHVHECAQQQVMKCTLTSLLNAHSIVPWRLFILTASISLGYVEPIMICRNSFFTGLTEFYQSQCVCMCAFWLYWTLAFFHKNTILHQITLSVYIGLCYFIDLLLSFARAQYLAQLELLNNRQNWTSQLAHWNVVKQLQYSNL